MASRLTADWREFLSLLISHRVKYLVIGAHAIAVHAQPRMTNDLDVFVEASPANARKLRRALEAFGFGSVAPELEELASVGKVFMLGEKPFRIDILTEISAVSFADAYVNRVQVQSEAGLLDVIGLEDLMLNKSASGRKKDLLDLELLASNAAAKPSTAVARSTPRKKKSRAKKRSRTR